MISDEYLDRLPFKDADLLQEIRTSGQLVEIEAGTEILRIGQYVKVIPIVIRGLVKVYSQYNEKELLLYYIKPNQSCIMSFAAGINDEKSNVYALTEEKSEIILLPAPLVKSWIKKYPGVNDLFYSQYNQRYNELILFMNHLMFDTLDKKVWKYLQNKVSLEGQDIINVTHQQIAHDLGTSREVVSRVLKKLEDKGQLKLHLKGIEITS